MNATITLREYLDKGKCFVIPNYQRGYIWGKKRADGAKDSVTYMMESLIKGYKTETEVFIQGVTVSESSKEIVLIDGQQRTTFFYFLLKVLGFKGEFNINYKIREESNKFMASDTMLDDIEEKREEEFQDIYFFKKTLRTINESIKGIDDRETFLKYVLDNVKFLYIDIPQEDKATKVFTMMNGNKAEMKAEELIKAELLRLASMNAEENHNIGEKKSYAIEWENNMLRSRYAREWDKWLQWWNRADVRKFYKTDCVMGLLVSTCQQLTKTSQLSFESFKQQFLNETEQSTTQAKKTFDRLRRLQKRFEDAFNNPKTYNWIGAIIRIFDKNNKDAFIRWYFIGKDNKNDGANENRLYSLGEQPAIDELEQYYKLAFLELTHLEITSDEPARKDIFNTKFDKRYSELESDNLYNENPEAAFRLLLRLNIDEDNLQEDKKGRKFDFSIWDRNDSRGRSLEHIYPKSKVYHFEIQEDGTKQIKNGNDDLMPEDVENDKSYINRASCKYMYKNNNNDVIIVNASEHSIGNLVLLYKDDNSTFNAISFEEKKELFFKKESEDKAVKAAFKSRHLLHTIYKFANSKWEGKDIAENKSSTLNEFKKYYGKE